MKRKLSPRELVLLAVLIVIALVSGYVMLWRMPMQQELEQLHSDVEDAQTTLGVAQARLEKKQQMQRELDVLFAENAQSLEMAEYDNARQVMLELNTILSAARDYDLSFGTVDTSQAIVNRNISIRFTADSYAQAESVLRQLHDSRYRSLLNDLSITVSDNDVSASAAITYFEHQ